MIDSRTKPVIFLAYANDRLQAGRYLRDAVEEIHFLRDLLEDRVGESYEVIVRDNASLDDLFEVFDLYKERIRIFHFAGHANNLSLLLDQNRSTQSRAGRDGFTRELAALPGLQLVFLNACTTRSHAMEMVRQGVPVSIATATDIGDRAAYLFSTYFYQQLVKRKSLVEAFDVAERRVLAALGADGSYRGLYWEVPLQPETDPSQFPWGIYGEQLQWRLRLRKAVNSTSLWPLMVDRDRQVIDFRDAVERILADVNHAPHTFIIHGARAERPQSLVTRFVETDLQQLSEQIFGSSRGVVHEHQVRSWPYTGALEQRQRELKRRLAQAMNFSGIGVSRDWTASEMVRTLNLKARTVVLHHTISTEKWDNTTLKLIRWYAQEFWQIQTLREFPQFVIFLNLLYPEDRPNFLQRFLGGKQGRNGIKELLTSLDTELEEQLSVLAELKPIRYEDVVSWVDDYFPVELADLPDVLFSDRDKRLTMEVVEPELRRALETLNLEDKGRRVGDRRRAD